MWMRLRFANSSRDFCLAIEDLHHAHAGDVFLQERVDARDGGADAAVGVAHAVAEEPGGHDDERAAPRSVARREPPVHVEKHTRPMHASRKTSLTMVDDARGEQIVERVHVGGDARDQAADRAAVEESSSAGAAGARKFPCAGRTASAGRRSASCEPAGIAPRSPRAGRRRKNDDMIDSMPRSADVAGMRWSRPGDVMLSTAYPKSQEARRLERSPTSNEGHRQHNAPLVRPQIVQQPPQQLRVVGFSELLLLRNVAHSRSSSSSSNCF